MLLQLIHHLLLLNTLVLELEEKHHQILALSLDSGDKIFTSGSSAYSLTFRDHNNTLQTIASGMFMVS